MATASFFYLADNGGLSAAPVVSLKTMAGHEVDLAAPAGKTRLVTFWSPDCPISERNVPAISKLQKQFGDEAFGIVAVAMPYSAMPEIDNYIEKNEVDFPVSYDRNGQVSDAFPGVRFTPTTFLIDGDGTIVWKHIGRMRATDAARQITAVLQPQQLAKR